MYLIFDTETTGLPKSWNAPIIDTDNWPRCIQIAWQLHDNMGNVLEHNNFLIQPDGIIAWSSSENTNEEISDAIFRLVPRAGV